MQHDTWIVQHAPCKVQKGPCKAPRRCADGNRRRQAQSQVRFISNWISAVFSTLSIPTSLVLMVAFIRSPKLRRQKPVFGLLAFWLAVLFAAQSRSL